MATPVLSTEWSIIDTVEVAEVLTDPKALRHLAPFMGVERTLSEVAAELGVTPQAMFYWVRKFCALGLLQVTREAPRRGKAVKYYRASAERYFIPFHMVPAETLEVLARLRDEPWEAQLTRNLVQAYYDAFDQLHSWGVCILCAKGQGWRIDMAPATGNERFLSELVRRGDMPAVLSCWSPLQLDFADAKAFQRDLDALIKRYQQKQGAQHYLARIALAPVVKE